MRLSGRRRTAVIVGLVGATLATVVAPAAATERGPQDQRTGPGYGLNRSSGARCGRGYQVEGTAFCSHGGDRTVPRRPAGTAQTAAPSVAATIPCDGDGITGPRVQAIYARSSATADGYAAAADTIRDEAAAADAIFAQSAAQTGGVRHLRFVTDAACNLSILNVVLDEAARTAFSSTITELQALGLTRADRKYLVWFDTPDVGICGIATWAQDDRPDLSNQSNTTTGYARVDRTCWQYQGWAEAHELTHTFGGVQDSAPHSTSRQGGFAHCSDEWDVMCYADATGVAMSTACPDQGNDYRLDCNHDDYFDASASPSGYLATHWNVANSSWLSGGAMRPPNDDFEASDPLGGSSGQVSGTSVGATKQSGEPNHAGLSGGTSVWYRWTAPSSGTVSLSTSGSNFDTILAVYTGGVISSLSPVASNDDASGGLTSAVSFAATAGVTYQIAVDGYSAASGSVVLGWSPTPVG